MFTKPVAFGQLNNMANNCSITIKCKVFITPILVALIIGRMDAWFFTWVPNQKRRTFNCKHLIYRL